MNGPLQTHVVEQLTGGAVAVYLARLDDTARDTGSLSGAERLRASRFVRETDRRRYANAHATLRELLASHTGVRAHELAFETGSHGKPRLLNAPRCHFNLSHCEGTAVIAISNHPVGVDVETLRPVPDAIELVREMFLPNEQAAICETPLAARSNVFLTAWTRKEAVLKCLGVGLLESFYNLATGAQNERLLVSVDVNTRITVESAEIPDCVIAVAWTA